MAAETGTGMLGRAWGTITALWQRSPQRAGSPEEEGAAPATSGMISRNTEVSFIPDAWLDAIATNDDTILARENGQGLALYEALLDDDKAMASLQKRRLAITSRDWEVAPGDDKDPRSVQAADDLRDMLKALGWDRVTGLMHYGVWFGYAVAEGLFTTKLHNGRLIVWLDDIVVPNRRWFGFTLAGELRMLTLAGTLGGEPLPPNKFWALRTGASHDFAFYGLGLAHWAYWPIFFKRAALKFWALYLEKYASPTVLAGFRENAEDDEKGKLLSAAIAIGQDRAVVVPKDLVDSIKFIEPTRSGSGVSSYQQFVLEQNDAIDRVILGQPGTSRAAPAGLGSNQTDVHADEQASLVKADSDLISEGFNGTFAKWLTRWNHGEDVAPPTVYRVLDDPDDVDTIAERDQKIKGLGWERTEESFKDVYGDGYEKAPEPEPPVVPGMVPLKPGEKAPAAANDDGEPVRRRAAEFGVDDVAPLYVSRKLLNAGELIRWAKAQGFEVTVPAEDMHVTVLYSKRPVDWFDMGDSWGNIDGTITVEAGGPRKVGRFDDEGPVVLRFSSPMLRYRHDSMVERGASHDYDEYRPHITISYDAGDVDLTKVEPFVGDLKFGPEIFEPIKESNDPATFDFAATELDAIDRLVAALVEDSSPVFSAMAETLRDSLQGVTTLEGARVALLDAMERLPVDRLARMTGLPYLAARATAAVGAEDALTA